MRTALAALFLEFFHTLACWRKEKNDVQDVGHIIALWSKTQYEAHLSKKNKESMTQYGVQQKKKATTATKYLIPFYYIDQLVRTTYSTYRV